MKRIRLASIVLLGLCLGFTSCEEDEPENQNGNEVVINTDITVVTTWKADKVYVIDGSITVEANLTIEPGTVIKFKTGSNLGFGYSNNVTLTANGTPDKHIVFTSYNSTPTPGAWSGVVLYSHVLHNTSLTYCDFLYAGYNDCPAIELRSKLTFNNNLIRHAKKIGIELFSDAAFVSMANNTIENCGTHAMLLYPSAIHTLGTGNVITCNLGYGIFVEGGYITTTEGSNLVWKRQSVPYIMGEIGVETNLTIEPGTILMFNAGSLFYVGYENNSKLTAIGTTENPIVFTSSNTTPAAGAWRGVFLYSNTLSNTVFDNCIFEYAGYQQEACLHIRNVSGVTVKNSTFRNSSGYGIFLEYATLSAGSTGNTFTNCALGNIGIEE